MHLKQLFSHASKVPRFPVPELAATLADHGFSHSGWHSSSDDLVGGEEHRFERKDCGIAFWFCNHIDYGSNSITLYALPTEPEGSARRREINLQYVLDYPVQLNSLMATGLTRDAALASLLDESIESSIRIYLSMIANGHLTPHAEDRLAGDRDAEF